MGAKSHTTGQGYTHRFVKYMSRIVRLSYLQTLQIQTDQRTAGEIAGETEGSTASGSTRQPGRGNAWWDPFGTFGSSKRSKEWSYSTDDTGWSIQRTWLETYWDKIRYAIGIRDIQVFNFRFAPTGELVSKRYSSPKEIIKVQLQVDEKVPDIFPLSERWIEYYVSIDDGQEWIRINPLDHPTLYDNSGQIVPRTINFNIDVGGPTDDDNKNFTTENPVNTVRFRALFKTDTTLLNGDQYTPVLKQYRMKLYPRGGLSTDESRNV